MPFTLRYSLGNAGWATVILNNGVHSNRCGVSYLHDTLEDFISAANVLMQGAPEAKVLMMEEPGEHLMCLQSDQAGNLDIEVRSFKDWASWDLVTEKEFDISFKAQTSVSRFAAQVLENTERILKTEGTESYREKWRREFPVKGWERLKAKMHVQS